MGCIITRSGNLTGKVVPESPLNRGGLAKNTTDEGIHDILPAREIITSDKSTDSKPIKFYASNHVTISRLKMAGEVTGYVEYVPDNVLEVETTMKDYIDLLMNPHQDIKPRVRKLKFGI